MNLEIAGEKGRPVEELIKERELEMRKAANELDFELAAILRDELKVLKKQLVDSKKLKAKHHER